VRRVPLCALVLATAACSGPTSPSLRSQVIVGSLSSVDHQMSPDLQIYPVDVSHAGILSASVQWVGEGDLWLYIFDAQPPTNHPPLASNTTSNAVPISASVVAGTYFVMVTQSRVIIGPGKGACGCVDNFTLTLTYP